ncbi:MAG: hypothetical protein A2301_03705 [Candidatus Magasanikbacteria bacterium RIFOXYB2_FULL_40_13]|uniref:Glycosyltransferase 2-like domain-containing protein n=1 Tax=Candidatus Magasanikbacteria bacterium RIFOXYA1_FULL_40_8 TaxID=1798694 RepID=A0A1F6NSQ0_9BACT|nr:MAG: hypothetical protein A2224_00095 [Candidatus Magasanikbacteria bacterium RIFOXYA2_FULL_40_20]OGH85764.1 MAG: hypothetical protein A2301_03705 [Candidatus Magasanikbacteria bacterium RIFOXYB2_FULL_40_13]OGH86949.1 MAG: hypothetical protein A2206_03370 [Candidatus Magasanikbacteria bacterium RIFOXYA1_FULL_40_8]
MNCPASLSIVIPCYDEEEVLPSTYARLKELCLGWVNAGKITEYEIVFVNDGSTDKTFDIMRGFFESDQNVVVVDFRKNFGFQSAISAGLYAAKNEMIVSIDSDLQNDPEKIAEMVAKYYEGYEMVLGVRKDRAADKFFKRITAQLFYKLVSFFGIPSVYNHADFRLLSRDIVAELKNFPERARYLRSLIFSVESKYACVYYECRARALGRSKFNFSKMVSLAIDGITSFSATPIRLISLLGIVMFLFSIIGLVYTLCVRFFLQAVVPGWASVLLIILFLGGIQNLSLGVIGEYLSKLYLEAKQRPPYIIRREYRHK